MTITNSIEQKQIETLRNSLLVEECNIETLENLLEVISANSRICKALWDSDVLIFVLLQNLTDSFYKLNSERFTEKEIQKVKICIDILVCCVDRLRIVNDFLKLQLDYYIYPFLMASSDESLKISALKLFHTLLKEGTPENMRNSELLPLLLKIIDSNSEISQILALETLLMILQGNGLEYAVQTIDRFKAIDVVIGSLLKKSVLSRNTVFLNILMKIYTRMCDKKNVRQKLKEKIPEGLDFREFIDLCEKYPELFRQYSEFLEALEK